LYCKNIYDDAICVGGVEISHHSINITSINTFIDIISTIITIIISPSSSPPSSL
jgi:hypothetical protein